MNMGCTLKIEQIAADIHEEFCMIDNDSDGVITVEKVASVMKCFIEHPKKQEIMNQVHTDHGDHATTDFSEFFSVMSREMKENVGEELKEAFKVFDRDQDGFISAIDLRNVMMNLGERLTHEEAEQMIREGDLDGDGLLGFEEFVIMFDMD